MSLPNLDVEGPCAAVIGVGGLGAAGAGTGASGGGYTIGGA